MNTTHVRTKTKSTRTTRRSTKSAVEISVAAGLLGICLVVAPTTDAYADPLANPDEKADETATLAAASAVPDDNYPYFIINLRSNLCLEPAYNGWGELVLQQPCVGTRKQKWYLNKHTDTRFLLQNLANHCMDVRDGVNADRTPVQLWGCDQWVPSMRWGFTQVIDNNYYKIFSDIGGRCMDVAGGSLQPGARIQIYRCSSGTSNGAQIFRLEPTTW
jgi:Ricin-type beta-trefoil lectin domain-like